MWDELENYLPILICSYVIPCSFGDIASVQRYREKDYVLRAFSLVIQQEKESNISVSNTIPNVGNDEEVTRAKGRFWVLWQIRNQLQLPTMHQRLTPQTQMHPLLGFTQEQYNNILEFLQQSKLNSQANSISTSPFILNSHSTGANGKNPTLWILNTSVIDHITFNISLFIEYKNIVHIPISFPNGSKVVASISGTVSISSSLTLHNVLYIPRFHNHSKAMIGISNLQRELYILDSTSHHSSFSSVTNNSCNAWPLRLGHAHRTKGFREGTKGYIVYDIQSHDIFVPINFIFYEHIVPFKLNSSSSSIPSPDHHTLDNIPSMSQQSIPTKRISATDVSLSSDMLPSTDDSNIILSPISLSMPFNCPSHLPFNNAYNDPTPNSSPSSTSKS
ncbi:hypothetical protein KIW84_023543 [Lathyrus oleraceus]|uniref:Retrovirus-related Pol polyprotein from transposon TNT 1-94-like beta-barrel domain-containing protein n=1 Tax=Pisum sativum TaxID=3888 RepID=A0A9D4YD85_PEA|nr:hypothetical protein KIW84_023543 [Pisum sativum]